MADWQPTLQGELTRVRPLHEGDRAALYAVAADPGIWRQHPVPDRHERAKFDAFFDDSIASGGALLVTEPDGTVIGSSRFHGHDPDQREVEIGWTFLARRCWGGAINGELKRLMIEHAFRYVDRVVLLVGERNLRSRRAVEKIGGIHRGTRVDGGGRPSLLFVVSRPGSGGSSRPRDPRS